MSYLGGIKLENNNKNNAWKFQSRLNNRLLDHTWVADEISGEIYKHFELNKNENKLIKMWRGAEWDWRGFIALYAHFTGQKILKTNHVILVNQEYKIGLSLKQAEENI